MFKSVPASKLLNTLVIISLLISSSSSALYAQDDSKIYLPLVSNTTNESESTAETQQINEGTPTPLPVSSAFLPDPDTFGILHHGAPSTPWTSFATPGVNTLFGNFVWQEGDVSVPGRGLGVAFARTYNSADPTVGPLGKGWTHSFNLALTFESASSLVIRMGDGRLERYTLLAGVWTPPTGVFSTLQNNQDGSYTLLSKEQIRYQFAATGQLLSILDRNNNTILLSYTGQNLTTITDPVSRTFSLSYDGNNRLISITDPLTRTVAIAYDASGNLSSVTNLRGKVTTYGYDANQRLQSLTDANNHRQFSLTYDGQGRVSEFRNATNHLTTYSYDFANGRTTVTDPRSFASIYAFDAQYRISGVQDALGATTVLGYDGNNNVTSVIDKARKIMV